MAQPLPELDMAAEAARRMKRDLVTRYGDGADQELCDLFGYCVVVRGGEQVAICHVGPGPEAVRKMVYWAACLMRPDPLLLVADVRFRYMEPEQTLEHGELAQMWEQGQREGITEAIVISTLSPSDPPTLTAFPYERRGKALRWLPAMPVSSAVDGAIVDHARMGFEGADKAGTLPIWEELKQLAQSEMPQGFDLDGILDRASARIASEKPEVQRVSLLNQRLSYVGGEEVPFPS